MSASFRRSMHTSGGSGKRAKGRNRAAAAAAVGIERDNPARGGQRSRSGDGHEHEKDHGRDHHDDDDDDDGEDGNEAERRQRQEGGEALAKERGHDEDTTKRGEDGVNAAANPAPSRAYASTRASPPTLLTTPRRPPRGTAPSYAPGRYVTSLGQREVDSILGGGGGGGGQPLGSVLLVEEDRWTKELARSLARYWCAEAASQGQILLLPATKPNFPQSLPLFPPLAPFRGSGGDDDDDDENTDLSLEENLVVGPDDDDDCYDCHLRLASGAYGGSSSSELWEFVHSLPRDLNLDQERKKKEESAEKNSGCVGDGGGDIGTRVSTDAILEVDEESSSSADDRDGADKDVEEEGLKIAWQYRKSVQERRSGGGGTGAEGRMRRGAGGGSGGRRNFVFCHSYDLGSRMADQYPPGMFVPRGCGSGGGGIMSGSDVREKGGGGERIIAAVDAPSASDSPSTEGTEAKKDCGGGDDGGTTIVLPNGGRIVVDDYCFCRRRRRRRRTQSPSRAMKDSRPSVCCSPSPTAETTAGYSLFRRLVRSIRAQLLASSEVEGGEDGTGGHGAAAAVAAAAAAAALTPVAVRLLLLDAPIGPTSVALPLLMSHARAHSLPIVVLVTVRAWRCDGDGDGGMGGRCAIQRPRMEHLVSLRRSSDAILSCTSFASLGSAAENVGADRAGTGSSSSLPGQPPPEFRDLTGILTIVKAAFHAVGGIGGGGHFADVTTTRRPQAGRYGLKRDRRKLNVTMLHLPPEEFSAGGGSVGGGGARSGGGRTAESGSGSGSGPGSRRGQKDRMGTTTAKGGCGGGGGGGTTSLSLLDF